MSQPFSKRNWHFPNNAWRGVGWEEEDIDLLLQPLKPIGSIPKFENIPEACVKLLS